MTHSGSLLSSLFNIGRFSRSPNDITVLFQKRHNPKEKEKPPNTFL
jgi:hypothetical protein